VAPGRPDLHPTIIIRKHPLCVGIRLMISIRQYYKNYLLTAGLLTLARSVVYFLYSVAQMLFSSFVALDVFSVWLDARLRSSSSEAFLVVPFIFSTDIFAFVNNSACH